MNFRILTAYTPRLLLHILAVLTTLSVGAEQMPNELMKTEAKLVTEMVEVLTPQGAQIGRNHGRKVIDTFLNKLDPLGLFFTEIERAEALEEHADTIWKTLRRDGEVSMFYELLDQFRKSATARKTWIESILDEDLSFDSNETYNRGPRSRPTGRADADKAWKIRLKHDLLREVIQGVELGKAKLILRARYSRIAEQADSLSDWETHELILAAILEASDSQSTYYSNSTIEELRSSFPGEQVGIGAVLRDDEKSDYVSIDQLIPGGPASLSGKVCEGDVIISVQQSSSPHSFDAALTGMRELTRHTAGPLDSELTITVASNNYIDEPRRTVSLIRSKPPAPRTTASTTLAHDKQRESIKVGIVELSSFYINENDGVKEEISASRDLERLLSGLKKDGAEALVIDLRNNEGGLLDEAINTCGLFISNQPVVAISQPSKSPYTVRSPRDKISYEQPIVVLISQQTAAAAEIFAGVLKHYGKAILVGDTRTAGSGGIHQVFPLEPYIPKSVNRERTAGMVKLSVGSFYLPDGRSVSTSGIQSDIILESLTIRRNREGSSAIYPNIEMLSSPSPVSASTINKLASRSLKRRKNQEAYKHHERNRIWLIEQRSREELSLNLSQRISDQKRNKTKHESFARERIGMEGCELTVRPISLNAPSDANQLLFAPEKIEIIDYQLKEAVQIAADAISLW